MAPRKRPASMTKAEHEARDDMLLRTDKEEREERKTQEHWRQLFRAPKR